MDWAMDSKNDENYLVNGLERGLEALLTFLKQPEMSFSAFVKATNLNKATAKRILYTLEKTEFLRFDACTNTYSLGIRTFELGTTSAEHNPLLRIARPYMESLCHQIKETVILARRIGPQQIYLHKIESEGTVRLETLVGHRRPLYYGLGKTVLAYMSEEEWDDQIKDIPMYSINTITDPEHFKEELRKIKAQNYAIDAEEYIEGVTGIGRPLFKGETGEIFGLIGIVLPTLRLTCENQDLMLKLLGKASKAISHKLSPEPGC